LYDVDLGSEKPTAILEVFERRFILDVTLFETQNRIRKEQTATLHVAAGRQVRVEPCQFQKVAQVLVRGTLVK
jgi:hypothetical protein